MNTELIVHIVISLLSLSGLIVYYRAFTLGYKMHNRQRVVRADIPEKLYYLSSYPAFMWYILPFISQPRMCGVYDWIEGELTTYNVVYVLATISIFIFFFCIWGKKSVSKNAEATKGTFYAPSRLLTDGIYARVQHPMVIGDILGHFALILFSGGIYTCILFPIYVFIDICMIRIQVKYSLEPYFASELKEYRKRTPALLDRRLTMILLLMIVLLISNVIISGRAI